MENKVLLGFCPIGKVLFSHEDACKKKREIQEKLRDMQISFVDLDDVLPETDGLVRDQAQCEKVITYFREKGVDAIFLPHCNFGTEGAAGMIAREMNVPVLLWGPRDDMPLADGSRLRDSLCGMLASSKVIRKLTNGKFTYIENCHLEESVFTNGLNTFLRAAAVVKAAKHMKIGLVGARIDFFWSCIVNEAELLERFGVEVIPFEIGTILKMTRKELAENRAACERELSELEADWLDTEGLKQEELLTGIALAHVLIELKEKHGLSVYAIEGFFSLAEAIGPAGSIYASIVNEVIPVADESDIHGAISLVMLDAAKFNPERVFFPEYVIRHPEDDNTVCMWHVGAPVSIRDPRCERVHLREPWILPGEEPTQIQMKIKNGPLTVCRFDGDQGNYRLGIGTGELIDGPETRDYYGWLRVNDWVKWERQLIEGPYIHHCAAAYGHCADALVEACKYLEIPVEVYGE